MSSLSLSPGAEATTNRREGSALIMLATLLKCSASANDVPPNFTTFVCIDFFLSKNDVPIIYYVEKTRFVE
jgi:hypothetical protein